MAPPASAPASAAVLLNRLLSRGKFRHLQVLLRVAELGSVQRAADAIGVTQSSVTQTLAYLEALLDTPVLRRHPAALALMDELNRAVQGEACSGYVTAPAPVSAVLPSNASNVHVSISDSAGQQVFSTSLGAKSAGNLHYDWNGLRDNGQQAASGKYTVKISATIDNVPTALTPAVTARDPPLGSMAQITPSPKAAVYTVSSGPTAELSRMPSVSKIGSRSPVARSMRISRQRGLAWNMSTKRDQSSSSNQSSAWISMPTMWVHALLATQVP